MTSAGPLSALSLFLLCLFAHAKASIWLNEINVGPAENAFVELWADSGDFNDECYLLSIDLQGDVAVIDHAISLDGIDIWSTDDGIYVVGHQELVNFFKDTGAIALARLPDNPFSALTDGEGGSPIPLSQVQDGVYETLVYSTVKYEDDYVAPNAFFEVSPDGYLITEDDSNGDVSISWCYTPTGDLDRLFIPEGWANNFNPSPNVGNTCQDEEPKIFYINEINVGPAESAFFELWIDGGGVESHAADYYLLSIDLQGDEAVVDQAISLAATTFETEYWIGGGPGVEQKDLELPVNFFKDTGAIALAIMPDNPFSALTDGEGGSPIPLSQVQGGVYETLVYSTVMYEDDYVPPNAFFEVSPDGYLITEDDSNGDVSINWCVSPDSDSLFSPESWLPGGSSPGQDNNCEAGPSPPPLEEPLPQEPGKSWLQLLSWSGENFVYFVCAGHRCSLFDVRDGIHLESVESIPSSDDLQILKEWAPDSGADLDIFDVETPYGLFQFTRKGIYAVLEGGAKKQIAMWMCPDCEK